MCTSTSYGLEREYDGLRGNSQITAASPESPMAGIDSLDLPDRVRARLRKLIAAGPPTDVALRGILNELRGNDEAMRAGLCWCLARARLTEPQVRYAVRSLHSLLQTYITRPLVPFVMRPLIVTVGALFYSAAAMPRPIAGVFWSAALVSSVVGAVRMWRTSVRRRGPGNLTTPLPVWALRAMSRSGYIPRLPLAVELAARGPEWLQHTMIEELDDLLSASMELPPLLVDQMTPYLLDLLDSDDAATRRTGLRGLAVIGEGWLAPVVEARLQRGARRRGVSGEEAEAGSTETLSAPNARHAEHRTKLASEQARTSRVQDPGGLDQGHVDLTEFRRQRTWERALQVKAPIAGAVLSGLAVLAAAFLPQAILAQGDILRGIILSCLTGALMLLLAAPLLNILRQPRPPETVWRSVEQGDVRAVGPLLEATRMVTHAVTQSAKTALTYLLPSIRAHHRALYTPYQRQCLIDLLVGAWVVDRSTALGAVRRVVQPFGWFSGSLADHFVKGFAPTGSPYDSGLLVAILRALKHIGDAGDLQAVRALARRAHAWRWCDHIHAGAVECAAILEERARAQSDAEVLLRPAATADETVLVRPAATSTTDAGLLVKPAGEAWPQLSGRLPVTRHGKGRCIVNSLRVRQMLGQDPTAERLLRNMLRYASARDG